MGGVQYLAESIDKPAAAVRGVLATGDPTQLLHAIPFSESMGIAPRKRYSGRELLRKHRLVGRNKPGFDLGDVAGFGAEVVLDPLWLLAGLPLVKGAAKAGATGIQGAKTLGEAQKAYKAARAAVKAGGAGTVLSRTPPRSMAAMTARIRAGKQALIGLRLPFAAEPLVTFGQGSKTAAWAFDLAYRGGYYNPLNWMRGVFSHTSGVRSVGEFNAMGTLQKSRDIAYAQRQMLTDLAEEFSLPLGRSGNELAQKFAQIAAHHGGQGDQAAFEAFTRAARESATLMPTADDLARLVTKHADLPATASLDDVVESTGGMADEFFQYIDSIGELQDAGYTRVGKLGGNTPVLEEIYGKWQHRRPSDLAISAKRLASLERGGSKAWLRRTLRNIPGMSHTINAMAMDPMLSGTAKYGRDAKALLRGGLTTQQKKQLLGDATLPHRGLRERLEDLGVRKVQDIPKDLPATERMKIWSMDDSLQQLQEKYVWHQHWKAPFEEFWAKVPVDVAGARLDDLGKPMLYPRGALKGQPITRQSEIARMLEPITTGTVVPGAAVKTKEFPSELTKLVKKFRNMPEQVRKLGIFDRGVLEDAMDYTHAVLEWESGLMSIHHFLGTSGAVGRASQGFQGKPLKQVWRSQKLGKGQRALTPEGLETLAARMFPGEDAVEVAKDLVISPGADNTLNAYVQAMSPQRMNEVGKFVDKINAAFKSYLFVPWPASHSRNFLSGYFQSWSDGRVSGMELAAGYWRAAMHVLKGEPLASKEILEATGILKGVGRLVEVSGEQAAREISGVPKGLLEWAKPFTPSRIRQKGIGASIDPRGYRGFKEITPEMRALGAKPTLNAPMEFGEEAYKLVEFLNRAGYAEALLKKGYTASEIKHLVARSQFDYSQLSRVEQGMAKRGVLFYTFPRKNVPFIFSRLMERPGGRTAQTLRALRTMRGDPEESATPGFLRETLGARSPFSPGTPEAANFIWQSGLPVEELNKIVVGSKQRTGEKLASFAHPLLQMPAELLAGRQFYTGRDIKDLKPLTGVSALDRALAYSPASRVISEARGVIDPRKTILQRGLNALTGFKTGTYDIEHWRIRDLEKALRRQLEEDPVVGEGTYYYVPEDAKAGRPDLQAKIRQRSALQKRIRDLRAERAAGAKR